MRSFQHVSIVTVGYFSVPDFPVVNDCFPFSWSGTLSSLIGNGFKHTAVPETPGVPLANYSPAAALCPLKFTSLCYNELNLQLTFPGGQKKARGEERSLSHVVQRPLPFLRQAQRGSHCCIRWRLI